MNMRYKNKDAIKRNIDWFKKEVFSKKILSKKEAVLDIGSGNGRLNQILYEYFDIIYNVEPKFEIDNEFKYNNVVVIKKNFEEIDITDIKFDYITFFLSFYLIDKKYECLKKCLEMMKDTGKVVIVEGDRGTIQHMEIKNICTTLNLTYKKFFTKKGKGTTSIIFLLWRNFYGKEIDSN